MQSKSNDHSNSAAVLSTSSTIGATLKSKTIANSDTAATTTTGHFTLTNNKKREKVIVLL